MSAPALHARSVVNPRMSWSSARVSPAGMVVVMDSEDIMGQDVEIEKLHEAGRAGNQIDQI